MGTILWGIIVFFGLDIKNVESRRSDISACLNPKTSTKHSGLTSSDNGECRKTYFLLATWTMSHGSKLLIVNSFLSRKRIFQHEIIL